MQRTIQHIAVAAMLAAAGAAQAADVTVAAGSPYNDLVLTGASALKFSADVLAAFDTAKLLIAPYGGATASIAKDTDDYYLQAAVSAPITTLTMDAATHAISDTTSTGGFTLSSSGWIPSVIARGTSVTVTDLSFDLVNRLVYGTISSTNNPTSKTEALWTIGSVSGNSTQAGPGAYQSTLSGLKLTTAGLDDIAFGLGMGSLGKTTLGAVTSFGSIDSTIIVKAVPEPSTYALMGLGLVGMGLASRRRKAAN